MQPYFNYTGWIMKDNLIFFQMEDDLNFWKMEDDLKFFENKDNLKTNNLTKINWK